MILLKDPPFFSSGVAYFLRLSRLSFLSAMLTSYRDGRPPAWIGARTARMPARYCANTLWLRPVAPAALLLVGRFRQDCAYSTGVDPIVTALILLRFSPFLNSGAAYLRRRSRRALFSAICASPVS